MKVPRDDRQQPQPPETREHHREEHRREPAGRRNFLGQGNDAFTCAACGAEVLPLRNGSFRNHCPECLWSLHVDRVPGDRTEGCGGLMRPVELLGSQGAGWQIRHRCEICGAERSNRTAEDDPRQPDSWDRLVELSARRGG